MNIDITFLSLRIFSETGGIEKVCRIIGKALFERTLKGTSNIQIISSHDQQSHSFGNRYFPSEIFTGCSNKRLRFLIVALKHGLKSKQLLLSHINLLPVGWLVKLLNPKVELILVAHGIEVWDIPMGYKAMMLKKCDLIISVSTFTRNEMMKRYSLHQNKLVILNNCLDPFLEAPGNKALAMKMRSQYGLTHQHIVFFTLTRMIASERYKGYDRVIEAMSHLKNVCPLMKYMIGGSYTKTEKLYIDQKIREYDLEGYILFAGFIPEEKLAMHFTMCDYYIMPSYKEGFGIVFIEALYYGLPVIAGNKDGSADALEQGKWGQLIDPFDINAIKLAIKQLYDLPQQSLVTNKKSLLSKFGYDAYKVNLEKILQRNHE